MQTYSTIKGKSNSDDGLSSPPPPAYTVHERKTFSHDGFESFPEYSRDENRELYEDPSDGFTHRQPHDDNDNAEESWLPTPPQTTEAPTPGKRKRRKPIVPKNKRKNRKGKASAAASSETAAPENYEAPTTEDAEDGEEGEEDLEKGQDEKWGDHLEGRKGARVTAKVADDEEFEFRPEEIDFMGRFKRMTKGEQKREMERLLESMI